MPTTHNEALAAAGEAPTAAGNLGEYGHINPQNFGLPPDIFQGVHNNFLDMPTINPKDLRVSPQQALCLRNSHYQMLYDSFREAPAIDNYTLPSTEMRENQTADECLIYPFRETPMISHKRHNRKRVRDITVQFRFSKDIEGRMFFQAAMDVAAICKSVYTEQKIVQKAIEVHKYREKVYRYFEFLQQSRLQKGSSDEWYTMPYPAVSPEEISSLQLEVKERDREYAIHALKDGVAKDTPAQRKRLMDYDTKILFAKLALPATPPREVVRKTLPVLLSDPMFSTDWANQYHSLMPISELVKIWQEFEETGYSETLHEPAATIQELIVEDQFSEIDQPERDSKRQRISYDEIQHQFHNFDLEIEQDTLPLPRQNGPSIYGEGSHCQKPPSFECAEFVDVEEDDEFVECEEEISFVRSSPPREVAVTYSEEERDEDVLQDLLHRRDLYYINPGPKFSSSSTSASQSPQMPASVHVALDNAEISPGSKVEPHFKKGPVAIDVQGFQEEDSSPATVSNARASSRASTLAPTRLTGVNQPPESSSDIDSPPTILDANKCPKCNKTYKHQGCLRNHVQLCGRNVSLDVPNFVCSNCGKKYKKNGFFQRHLSNCTPDNNLQQPASIPKHERGTKRTPQKLKFGEQLLSAHSEGSDSDDENESNSNIFANTTSNVKITYTRKNRQRTRSEASRKPYGVKKGSLAEQLDVFYGPKSKRSGGPHFPQTPTTPKSPRLSPGTMIGSTPEGSNTEIGANDGYAPQVDLDDGDSSPTPGPKKSNIRKQSGSSMALRSDNPSTILKITPGSRSVIENNNLLPVSRILTLEPGLSELQNSKPRRTSRRLFSSNTSAFDTPSNTNTGLNTALDETTNPRTRGVIDLDFPPLTIPKGPLFPAADKEKNPDVETKEDNQVKRPRGWNLRGEHRRR